MTPQPGTAVSRTLPTVVADAAPGTGRHQQHLLTTEQFVRVREWVYQRTGIQFGDSKRYFVDRRVLARIQAHGGDFDRWFASLRPGDRSRTAQQLINELTVNETYFLRESGQFEALTGTVLPALLGARPAFRGHQQLRILSLPCSTGEEPYSIGLHLLAEWPQIDRVDVEIVAADIDTRVLEIAQLGEYGAHSLHRVSERVRTAWFDPAGRGRYRVKPQLRDAIRFSCVNVCDTAAMRPFQAFDVVFCRNLLIYFDALSSRRAAENIFGALRPGGYLFLGDSESMSRITTIFEPVRLPRGIVYRRPVTGATP